MSNHSQFLFIFFLSLLILQFTCGNCHGNPRKKLSSTRSLPCISNPHKNYAFCNVSLELEHRSKSLIALLTLDEKIQQLCSNASAIPRLGIPAYEWWSESLHGLAGNGPGVTFDGPVKSATVFPQVILAAASFNRSLWKAVASAISVEAMAMYNEGQAGLTFFAPNINIFRDPRWGRGQETPGEDPMVVSSFAVEYVRGIQDLDDGDEGKLKLSACCKHFTAYDLEKWGQFNRYNFNAIVTPQDMADTYQPPFQNCIQKGEASCLMCSYNSVNGIPMCANKKLLQKARADWNLKGYITSDCDASATIFENQKYVATPEDAVSVALKAGTDITCGTYMLRHMKSAVEQGKVFEADIDKALLNLFSVQIRLGLFDGSSSRNQFGELGLKDVCTPEHRTLALEATRQGIVLLKNDHNFLPLQSNGITSLAVIGPMANSTNLGGGYAGIPCHAKSVLEGLQEHVSNVHYEPGCLDIGCNSTFGFAAALSVTKHVEYTIVLAGLDLTQETEDLDRYSLLLPGYQEQLITSIAAVSQKPLVLILTGGGPIDVTFAKSDPRIASILWIGYPGESGGQALSEIIFGHYNPGGKLPMTWYPESFTTVPMNNMNMRPDPNRGYPGRTHRFYTGDVVFRYGEGLSYTKFKYKVTSAPRKLSIQQAISIYQTGNSEDYVKVLEVADCSSLRFQVHISVTNEGDMDGSHVVLLFSKSPVVFGSSPQRALIGFHRIQVRTGEMETVEFVVDPCEHMSFADRNGDLILPVGDFILVSDDVQHLLSVQTEGALALPARRRAYAETWVNK